MPLHLDELSTEIIAAADTLSSAVNGLPRRDLPTLGRRLAQDHRTLIQNKAVVVWEFLRALSELHQKGCYDLRNEAACKWAHEVVTKTADKAIFPFM
jgi:hypothetical protein